MLNVCVDLYMPTQRSLLDTLDLVLLTNMYTLREAYFLFIKCVHVNILNLNNGKIDLYLNMRILNPNGSENR